MYIITDWNPFEKVPRKESENFCENVLSFRFLKGVDFSKKSLCFASRMCSIGKHPRPPACGGLRGENRGFRTLNDAVLRASLIPTSRLLRIITCHTSSLFYVTACHMTRCIVKTAAPILFGAVVSSCKASQIFFHILILRKASIMSPMCSGCGGMRPSRIAPRQEKDTTKVVSFSFLNFFIFLLDK